MRFILLFLVLLNGVFFAWSQGFLKDYGFAPAGVGEPQRLGQQIRPEALRLLRPDEIRRLDAAAARSAECLQAGPLDEGQAQALRQALQGALPANTWEMMLTEESARWIVYMGKYANAQALVAKRAELVAKNLKFEPVANASLEPGLSLGVYASQQEAETALAALSQRGVRTAKVVQEKPETRSWLLKLAAVDESMKPQFDDLRLLLAGKTLRSCK